LKLKNKICKPKLFGEEVSEYTEILYNSVPHPIPSDLIFWNEKDLSPVEVEIDLTSYVEK
jgi:hypothetical protein